MEGGDNNNEQADYYRDLQRQYQPAEADELVQVVYQSNQGGSLIGAEGSFLADQYQQQYQPTNSNNPAAEQQPIRSSSTLPSVAEESSNSAGAGIFQPTTTTNELFEGEVFSSPETETQSHIINNNNDNDNMPAYEQYTSFYAADGQAQFQFDPNAIYSTINKPPRQTDGNLYSNSEQPDGTPENESSSTSFYTANCNTLSSNQDNQQQPLPVNLVTSDSGDTSSGTLQKHSPIKELQEEEARAEIEIERERKNLIEFNTELNSAGEEEEEAINNEKIVEEFNGGGGEEEEKENFSSFLSRQKGGAAESGSFRHNFRKKLGVSVSTNENDLIAHRQKLLEVQEGGGKKASSLEVEIVGENREKPGQSAQVGSSKFKRTHSVSFNVGSSRNSRHSVDIRNLPSYLTHKRASIVDVAKGAMSSLMHSLGASGGSGASAGSGGGSQRRDSSPSGEQLEEPIFEEPIAPTLSLGQRVALVRNSGAEFGTVGWIGQLPEVDDDWIVGVIFDNMIGNCDGQHNGVRYFYARENYAMFVPLSSLTKTDNYIGRPETGTMLSRMSVSLKPGQLISIHRSSIRLQHCFLNAPHQRVGHDVRAVSNRLHCQCHNCGPCAHLTKQGQRVGAPPIFGTHHAPNKKNSLAHMAVELLAHHHHHYHDEEEHEEEDHQFGDNSAHACNFVRYSCCQQHGSQGHDFSADCQMVRPELLDNLIHAPRAPHRRSRPRRKQRPPQTNQQQQLQCLQQNNLQQIEQTDNYATSTNQLETLKPTSPSTMARSESPCSTCSSNSSRSSGFSPLPAPVQATQFNSSGQQGDFASQINYQNNLLNFTMQTTSHNAYSTIDSQMSILDQRKFIRRRESSSYQQSDDDYYNSRAGSGLASSIRRCFACIIGRKTPNDLRVRRRKRPKKRKLSARNRMIEYRRRQSTFVPSTLAKPQDDFASHGIILPSAEQDSNSDYSSYTRSSSGNSSRSQSPPAGGRKQQPLASSGNQIVAETHYQMMGYEQQQAIPEHQLKSRSTKQEPSINYGDYALSSDNGSIYKKGNSFSRDSALTDLGNYDSWNTSNSNDTLKQIVDNSINEQEPIRVNDYELVSPSLSTDNGSHISEQIDVSSPTASILEQPEVVAEEQDDSVNEMMNNLNLDNKPEE